MSLEAVEVRADGTFRATVRDPGGAPDTIDIGAVVLATGGFGANKELVHRNLPTIADALYFGSAGNTGSAITIGRELGVDIGYLDSYQGHGSVAAPTGIMVTWASVMHGGVILNGSGRRFDDESQGYSEYAEKVLAQPEGICWLVLDERIDKLCRSFVDYARLVESGAIHWVNDRGALAARIGASPSAVELSLSEADAAARGDIPDPLGRRVWERPLSPPYGVVRITGALFHTQGGLLVDEHARVLQGGRPIARLFAAGGAAAGMSGHGAAGYLAGNGLLAALGLGYLAGSTAAVIE
jgi:fumarate reductase flavoprotein subunit